MTTDFTFNFTEEQFTQMIPGNTRVSEWFSAICKLLPQYQINTEQRVAMFVAQTAHESGNYRTLVENLNYSAQGLANTWPTRFAQRNASGEVIRPPVPNDLANRIQRNPVEIANYAYCDRMGNGTYASGDGWRYRGQGLIQLTGKENQTSFAASRGMNVTDMEAYLSTFDGAVDSACWYWNSRYINPLCDVGDIVGVTKKINGGDIGLDDRKNKYNNCMRMLGVAITESTVRQTVRRGTMGPAVVALQTALGLTPADGIFGPGTERALKDWQSVNGLTPDGIAGPATLNKLLG